MNDRLARMEHLARQVLGLGAGFSSWQQFLHYCLTTDQVTSRRGG